MSEKPPLAPALADSPRRRRAWRWLGIGGLALVILLAVGRLLLFDVHDGEEQALQASRWDGKPRFVETASPTYGLPANAGIRQRLGTAFLNLQTRYGKKNPATYTFGAQPAANCFIHGLLNQCMTVTGTRYLIAAEAIAGSVQFGHSNTLTGAQWVTAFEAALQNNRPEWWESSAQRLQRENLLLIREKSDVVKVVPSSRLADYQQAGLVDPTYQPPPSPTL